MLLLCQDSHKTRAHLLDSTPQLAPPTFNMSVSTLRSLGSCALKHSPRAASRTLNTRATHRAWRMSGPSSLCPLTEHLPLRVRLAPLSSYHTSVISLKEPSPKRSDDGKFKLTLDTVNRHLRNMEYAVRGLIPIKAAEIEKALKQVSGML